MKNVNYEELLKLYWWGTRGC